MMSNSGIPYIPGEPVGEPPRFFGRGDLLASVTEQLVRDHRVILVGGTRRIGKTSFLLRLSAELPDAFVPIVVGLAGEGAEGLERVEGCIAQAAVRGVSERLSLPLPGPVWGEQEAKSDRFLSERWPQVREALGDRLVVLLLDDLDRLQSGSGDSVGSLCAFLLRWRRQDHRLALVITVGSSQLHPLEAEYPALFAGAFSATLGPLPNEDAIRLITQPVEGRVTYDHGVPRRLVELTSGQPYYLQLVCAALYRRCAGEGWVNQHDVDLVVEELAAEEIPEFRLLWDESSPEEQAVLAALAALRGARGVATASEILGLLVHAGVRVTNAQVVEILERLSAREVVERLGALSYRLRIALLRDWLGKHVDLRLAMRAGHWEPPSRRRAREIQRGAEKPVQRSLRPEPAAGVPELGREGTGMGLAESPQEPGLRADSGQPPATAGEAPPGSGRRRTRGWLVPVGLACMALILIGARLARHPGRAEPTASPTATASAVSGSTKRPITPTVVLAKSTASPVPPISPSPTAPVITSRSLPAIAYLSKPEDDGHWTVYVMGSDGSNRIPVTEASADLISEPSWSPSGDRLAFVSDRDGNSDIWVVDREGRHAANLTHDAAKASSPAWSPDGEWIAFASVRDSPYWELYAMHADGSDVRRLTWWADASDLWPSWSPDGSRLAFASKRDGNWEIYTMASDGSDLVRLTDNRADDMHPAWSPDGQWIGFDSLREGYSDVFVMPAAGGDAVNLTRLAWASDLGPTWSPDGSRIAFCSDRNGDWDVYTIAVDGSDAIRLTTEDTQDQLPAWRP